MINSYDFDGVITTGNFELVNDGQTVVVTGRCFDESEIVYSKLAELDAHNVPVFFNPASLAVRGTDTMASRVCSALHKASVLNKLSQCDQVTHYEDDPVQFEIIESETKNTHRLPPKLVLVPGFVEPLVD